MKLQLLIISLFLVIKSSLALYGGTSLKRSLMPGLSRKSSVICSLIPSACESDAKNISRKGKNKFDKNCLDKYFTSKDDCNNPVTGELGEASITGMNAGDVSEKVYGRIFLFGALSERDINLIKLSMNNKIVSPRRSY